MICDPMQTQPSNQVSLTTRATILKQHRYHPLAPSARHAMRTCTHFPAETAPGQIEDLRDRNCHNVDWALRTHSGASCGCYMTHHIASRQQKRALAPDAVAVAGKKQPPLFAGTKFKPRVAGGRNTTQQVPATSALLVLLMYASARIAQPTHSCFACCYTLTDAVTDSRVSNTVQHSNVTDLA